LYERSLKPSHSRINFCDSQQQQQQRERRRMIEREVVRMRGRGKGRVGGALCAYANVLVAALSELSNYRVVPRSTCWWQFSEIGA
jgi:hypothetical protein